MWEIGEGQGWSRDETSAIVDYAVRRGWAQHHAMGGSISITIDGLDLAEAQQEFPQLEATPPTATQSAAGPVTVNINAPLTSPVIQVGGAGSHQKMEVASTEAILAVRDVARELFGVLRRLNQDSEEVRQLQADVATASAQLDAPAPRKGVLLETIRSISENALGAALGELIVSMAPALPALIQAARTLLGG
jgi:hypothetical protein